MMKYFLLSAALVLSASSAHAFKGDLNFTKTQAGVSRTLKLSNWVEDKKSGPSFDYSYEEKGKNCQYQIKGHVTAFLEGDGTPTVNVWEGDNGKETKTWTFYEGEVNISMPYKKSQFANFYMPLTDELKKTVCDKKADNVTVNFGKM